MAKDEINVCPNCGYIVKARDFIGFDSALNVFNCPRCIYKGAPLAVPRAEYKSIKFNKSLKAKPVNADDDRINRLLYLILIIGIIVGLAATRLEFLQPFLLILAVAACGLLAYSIFKNAGKNSQTA